MTMKCVRFAECDQCNSRGPEKISHSEAVKAAVEEGWVIHVDFNSQSVTCPKCYERDGTLEYVKSEAIEADTETR